MMSVVHMSFYRYKKDLKNFLKSFATKKKKQFGQTLYFYILRNSEG